MINILLVVANKIEVYRLRLSADIGPVIVYWEKDTRSYAFSGQSTLIEDDRFYIQFDDGDSAFIHKSYVYEKKAIVEEKVIQNYMLIFFFAK